MRILMIGAGAVSGYFGARLVQQGRDVKFLVRERRAEQLRQKGLCIAGALGEFRVEPQLVTARELAATPVPFDLILLGVKAYSLAEAMEDFAPAVGSQTSILPLLNGMAHLDALAARFGGGAVLGGLTRVVAYLEADGRIVLIDRYQDLVFGELDGQSTPRIARVDATLKDCGFDAVLSTNIVSAMWLKWVLLSSMGAVTLLARGNVGEINRAWGGRDLALAIVREAGAIAQACGHGLAVEDMISIEARLTRTDSTLVSSLYRDLSGGGLVEADQIFGDLLRRGAEHGVKTPLLGAAYTLTKVYEARRR
jgi:2-dehydropantoate 2-reductase